MKDTLFQPGDKIPEPQMSLESMRIALQQHEAILLYRFKTLDLKYHRRRDEIYQKYKASVAEDNLKKLPTHDERLAKIKRRGRQAHEATEKLKEEFNLDT